MKAIVQSAKGSLVVKDIPVPTPTPGDVLVKVKSLGFNPIDYKFIDSEPGTFGGSVVGWDAVGTIEKLGSDVSKFRVGDIVWFAGSLVRDGCFAEYVAVDHRIISLAPKGDALSLAAYPLVSLTAMEAYLNMGVDPFKSQQDLSKKTVLIVAGAGGVGSIATQIARILGFGRIIATASRSESKEWCKSMGATEVVGHSLEGVKDVDYAILCHEGAFKATVDALKPFGRVTAIVPSDNIEIGLGFNKAIQFNWTFMFTRSMFGCDLETQGRILEQVKRWSEENKLESIATKKIEFTIENIVQAHDDLRAGKNIGKTVTEFK